MKKLTIFIALLAVFLCWCAVPTTAFADEGIIEYPEDGDDLTPLDLGGLSADPQTFDVEVWSGPVVPVGSDATDRGGFWKLFLNAFEDFLQRMWEIGSRS